MKKIITGAVVSLLIASTVSYSVTGELRPRFIAIWVGVGVILGLIFDLRKK